ncbi:uncharacterized protein TERG_08856 [Trichophyton rubrum CBS 118892]|uniref:Uncharacterized protein n=1 Tax=Trichophyton rubrum (strain ATCC MYA-4607 / CBS 118892) TaxID=559305 RepID=F2SRK4_TRIRC|nr:uncharacterized protein TERG_08856 [Trichophyton rubrum CBS 118892]EGD88972.2 hypothetical protein TERG_08856 [Trichophyton rubrum CBS 118892]
MFIELAVLPELAGVHEGGGEFPTTVAKTGNLKIFDGKEEIGTLFVDLEVINEWPGLTEDEEKEAEGAGLFEFYLIMAALEGDSPLRGKTGVMTSKTMRSAA